MEDDVRRAELLADVVRLEAQRARLEAGLVRVLAEYAVLCAPEAEDLDGRPASAHVDAGEEELAAALMSSTRYACALLQDSHDLDVLAPATTSRLTAGEIPLVKARTVAKAVNGLTPQQAGAVDRAVAPLVHRLTLPQLRERLRLEVVAVAPAVAAERYRQVSRGRSVFYRRDEHGACELVAHGPADAVVAAWTALDRRARAIRQGEPDGRTAGAIAFDLLVDAALADEGERVTAANPLVQVTVSLDTMLGLERSPADLAGYGPVPAEMALDMAAAANARLLRLVTDPVTGVLVGIDGHTHPVKGVQEGCEPGPRFATGLTTRFVRARDRCCTVPWCHRPAARCDLDHVQPYPGGGTCPCNLHPLCRSHHQVKQQQGWSVRRTPEGRTVWSLPSGRTVTRDPVPALPVPRTGPDPLDVFDMVELDRWLDAEQILWMREQAAQEVLVREEHEAHLRLDRERRARRRAEQLVGRAAVGAVTRPRPPSAPPPAPPDPPATYGDVPPF